MAKSSRGRERDRARSVAQVRRLLEKHPRIVVGMAQLLVHTADEGRWFEVPKVCHVGADEGCHVRLSSATTVPLLCTITLVDGGWELTTECDQVPVRHNGRVVRECTLRSGDLLELPTWAMLFVENRNDDTGDVPKGAGDPANDPTAVLT